jgi:hypothetical protein
MEPICEVCLEPIESEDGLSYYCEGDCGRCGFCIDCALPENHDCGEDEEADEDLCSGCEEDELAEQPAGGPDA